MIWEQPLELFPRTGHTQSPGWANRVTTVVTGLDTAPGSPKLPEDIVSIQQLPGRIIAESRSGPNVLPELVGLVLNAGLKIERIELREPDLTDVFAFFTGQALSPARETG